MNSYLVNYTAFIDESFSNFFDLSDDSGYYCAGVFLLPTNKLNEFNEIFTNYKENLHSEITKINRFKGTTIIVPEEIKSSKLRVIDPENALKLITPLTIWLQDNGGYIGSFFTSTKGFYSFIKRDNAAPSSYQQNGNNKFSEDSEKEAIEDILEKRNTKKGESFIISYIFRYVVNMIHGFCRERNIMVDILFDPRSGNTNNNSDELTEDNIVSNEIKESLSFTELAMINIGDIKQSHYGNISCDIPSESSVGIQFADHVTGYFTRFFRKIIELRTESCSENILTPKHLDSVDDIDTYSQLIQSMCHKNTISSDTAYKIFSTTLGIFPIGLLRSLFLNGRISCFTENGIVRTISLMELKYIDLFD